MGEEKEQKYWNNVNKNVNMDLDKRFSVKSLFCQYQHNPDWYHPE